MSPFEVIENLDPLASLIQFRTSPVYELLMGVHTLMRPPRWHEAWAERTRAAISPKLLKSIQELYQLNGGSIFMELPVDYKDHADVPGFFRYIHALSDVDFIFYMLGRVVPREELAPILYNAELIQTALTTQDEHFAWYGKYIGTVITDIAGFKARLISVWESFWNTFFKREIVNFEPMWNAGIKDKRTLFESEGGRALLEKVAGRADLPPELPPGMPFTSIVFTPVTLLPSRCSRFYGYGNMTILFDPQYTEERQLAIQAGKAQAVATLRALDDETRLEILKMIIQFDGGLHGKEIARKAKISPSAVSRHLALLKDGGLIREEPQKNLIMYRFQPENLHDLLTKLLDYLYS